MLGLFRGSKKQTPLCLYIGSLEDRVFANEGEEPLVVSESYKEGEERLFSSLGEYPEHQGWFYYVKQDDTYQFYGQNQVTRISSFNS